MDWIAKERIITRSVKWRRRSRDSRAEVCVSRISIGLSSPPLPLPARIHTGSNRIAFTRYNNGRQAVAFITRLSNAPTAKRENNTKAHPVLYRPPRYRSG